MNNLKNCVSVERRGRYEVSKVYEEALVNVLVPILLDRLESLDEKLCKIERQLMRNKERLKEYSDVSLTKHGYKQVGYLKGMIRIQEDMLDIFRDEIKEE